MAEPAQVDRAKRVLQEAVCLIIATSKDDGPWVVPVNLGYQDGTIVWHSLPTAKHSENLAANPRVAFTIISSGLPKDETAAMYGTADVSVEPGDGPHQYVGAVTELWLVDNAPTPGGRREPRISLDPAEILSGSPNA